MKTIEGADEDFRNARVVYVTTYDTKGKQFTRPMTNYNEDPYGNMWFATFRQTKKVEHVSGNPAIKITFPSNREGEVYEIMGSATIGSDADVREKWRWWMLYWNPEWKKYPWFTEGSHLHERAIINVCPTAIKVEKNHRLDFNIRP